MKFLTDFLKTTLVGGLVIVFPLLVFYLLFGELLDAIIALATPIADLFPEDTFAFIVIPDILAILLILISSFVLGLVVRLRWLARLGSWLESVTLAHLPFYRAVKQLSRGLIGISENDAFRGGMLHNADGSDQLIYLIEELKDKRVVILVPFAPASFTGSVLIVDPDRVTPLDISAGEVSKVIAHWGVGTSETLWPDSEK